MRQAGAMIGNIIDVKEPCARNMAYFKFSETIAVFVWQMPACIQNAQVGMFQIVLEPLCRDKCLGIVLCVAASANQGYLHPRHGDVQQTDEHV